jgi:hypothetical protein
MKPKIVLLIPLLALLLLPAAQGEILVVPGAAHAEGAASTLWRTDVWIFNSTPGDVDVSWQVFPGEIPTCVRPAVLPPTIPVAAGATVRLTDLLDGKAAVGFVEIGAPAGVIVRARTFNATLRGSYGQNLPVLDPSDFAGGGSTLALGGLSRNGDYRTNLLLVSPSAACNDGESFVATLIVRDRFGVSIGTGSVVVPSAGQAFVSDPFGRFGAGDCSGCRIDVTAPSPFFAFASTIDNRTGDPTTVTPGP